jgi:hypothetical protein
MLLLLAEVAFSQQRDWQTGKITRAEEPKRRKPEPEVWNPSLTHWYTIETKSEIIRATEMVPAGVKRSPLGVDREPPLSFGMGQDVKFSLQTPPPTDPKKARELYVLDRKGKEHVLTVDQIVPKARQ